MLPPTSEGSAPYPRHAMTPPASMPPDSTPVTPVSRLGSEQHQAIRRLSEVPRPRSYSTGAAMGVAKPPSAPFHNNWKLRVFEQVCVVQLTVWFCWQCCILDSKTLNRIIFIQICQPFRFRRICYALPAHNTPLRRCCK